jgi:hypothetical protein
MDHMISSVKDDLNSIEENYMISRIGNYRISTTRDHAEHRIIIDHMININHMTRIIRDPVSTCTRGNVKRRNYSARFVTGYMCIILLLNSWILASGKERGTKWPLVLYVVNRKLHLH